MLQSHIVLDMLHMYIKKSISLEHVGTHVSNFSRHFMQHKMASTKL